MYFGLMYRVKTLLPVAPSRTVDLMQTLVAGTVGGLVATLFNAPFDNVGLLCASYSI